MRRILISISAALCIVNIVNAFHILVVFPFPGRSHGILGEGLVKRLLEGGHEVTYITPFLSNSNNAKLHEIFVPGTLPTETLNIKAIMENKVSTTDTAEIVKTMLKLGNDTFHNAEVQSLLRDRTRNLDAVIMDVRFSDFSAGYAAVLEVPLISFISLDYHSLALEMIDEMTNPSYVPSLISGILPPFSFIERAKQLGIHILLIVFKQITIVPKEVQLYEKTFAKLMIDQGRTPPAYRDLIYNSSLMFGNSHVSMGGSLRLPQNYKPIGGYHIDAIVEPLPEGLQKIMDSAKNGVIYFSMGTNLKSKELPDSVKRGLLQVFGELNYTVLWKFEEVLPEMPSNVRILEWAPQHSILAHPNCILFITHGGLLSTIETVHFGIPIIGIPVLRDQFLNVERAQMKGFALKVSISYNLADDLKGAIDEILSNSSYTIRAKELSTIYHDRPAPPGKELVHWVEHVINTGGAPHLRSPALMLPWYQKIYLDLAAIILIIVFLIKLIIRKFCCKAKAMYYRKEKIK